MGNDGVEDIGPKSNMTPRSGNIAQWMVENVEGIMRDSCEALHGRLIVIPDGTVEEEDD